MKKCIYHYTLCLLVFFIACKDQSKKDPILEEAFGIHKESIDIAAKAVKYLEKLPAQDTMRTIFETRLQDWGENMVEVPGFHYHHDGLGHHHGRTPLKLVPNDMLLLQKEFKDSIQSIYQMILDYEEELNSQ